ncbi:uncharacterized protein N7484_004885 [Penicillium longicatenatum]|uniref:uncharacterized protein n=1 Tax=Penicillium longicatenatum TaxID=1561947 RepID=UPI002547F611|nr:uncharacterized protein N7484_004885 [Penicillium longicatenatum]KAJ5651162.1 hypothetical protein N7484_004885 [Penicillium longicatenatum]
MLFLLLITLSKRATAPQPTRRNIEIAATYQILSKHHLASRLSHQLLHMSQQPEETNYTLSTPASIHIKNQIERATIPIPDEYTAIDEITATAEKRNRKTGETTFVFDPPYARVLFAKGINKRNTELKLPEHEPAGDWLVSYDLDKVSGNNLTNRVTKRVVCSNFGCYTDAHCRVPSAMNRVDNECDAGRNVNAIGSCIRLCTKAVDTPKEDGETDASYYERMDKLHWH